MVKTMKKKVQTDNDVQILIEANTATGHVDFRWVADSATDVTLTLTGAIGCHYLEHMDDSCCSLEEFADGIRDEVINSVKSIYGRRELPMSENLFTTFDEK